MARFTRRKRVNYTMQLEFLIEAKERGYYIPEAMFENAQAYLNSIAMRVDIPKADVLYLLAFI